MNKNIIVYWSPYWEDTKSWNLLYKDPERLIKRLSKRKSKKLPDNNFLRCPAYIDTFKNTFVVDSVLACNYEIQKGQIVKSEGYASFLDHLPTLENQTLLTLSMGWLFFTEEESLTMRVTPPYFEKSNHNNFGVVIPGSFDIGKWFRRVNLEFILWENVNFLKIAENEPLVYFNFETSHKVELKRFEPTENIMKHASHVASFSDVQPNKSLREKYKLFKQTRYKDLILKEIKKNVL